MGQSITTTPRALLRTDGYQGSAEGLIEEGLSDIFMQFLFSASIKEPPNGPPSKRQKLSSITEEFEHIVIKRTSLTLRLPNTNLRKFDEAIERQRVPILVKVVESADSIYHVRVHDISGRSRRQILDINLPAGNDVAFQDIQIATLVAAEAHHWQNPQGPGRLWTETDIRLGCDDSSDYLQLCFTVKWNTTPSVAEIPRRHSKRPALNAVLAKYFPSSGAGHVMSNDAWSAQAFYHSVHVPVDDKIATSIIPGQLTSELYPFQKRTLRWLLEREDVEWSSTRGCVIPRNSQPSTLPYSFCESRDGEGQICYVSHLFNVVTRNIEPYRYVENMRGGILAEEMGLGKTVEIIALICLHKRTSPEPVSSVVQESEEPRPTAATLIITPQPILQQWITELARHSPSLTVFHYKGIKSHPDMDASQLLENLSNHDVILTTYNVLSSEIHYTLPAPDRRLRSERKYIRSKSPLVGLLWWRVCLDEAQMVENGVTNAATVAKLIPRRMAWCITGTPVQKDVADLLGLLVFLRLEPYISTPYLWSALITQHHQNFHVLFNQLALRHSKHSVRSELRLPIQKLFVMTIPFTAIEEQHYRSLFQEMCEDCGLDTQGNPLRDDWNPEESGRIEQMRTWLIRLRQTTLHPEIGGRNRRALGHKQGPLRTVDDVLAAMLDQTEAGIRVDQRALLLSRLRQGQLLEDGPEVKRALQIWTEVLLETNETVAECRQCLLNETNVNELNGNLTSATNDQGKSSEDEIHNPDDEDSTDASMRVGTLRNRLRAALEIQHMATFFQANGYFQLKSNEALTHPDSSDFKELEKLETEGYERAKQIRQEILKEVLRKVNRLMLRLSNKASLQTYVQIPEFPSSPPRGGIESRRIMEQLNQLGITLDAQANHMDEWREQTIKLLLRPLVDEDEGMEITGDEYEESTKTQDEVVVLVQALRTVIEDRHDALTGQENLLVSSEVRTALKLAEEGEGPFPEKFLQLFRVREQVKPPREAGSIRGIVSGLRALSTTLRIDAENGSSRAASELSIVENERQRIQRQYNDQSKAVASLRQEIDVFTALLNLRLEYYRQLQQISDMVAPLEDAEKAMLRETTTIEEERLVAKIASTNAKRRYLIHLRDEATTDSSRQRMCVICQSSFEIGALTVCGHQFCKECMGLWWNAHHNCPVCKRKLTRNDLHDITYKPQALTMSEESAGTNDEGQPSGSFGEKSTIYFEMSKSSTFAEIKNIDLDGPSFTTKISTIARHLLWLREKDPGAKAIIFSQFKEFLDILGRALGTFRIGFSTIDKPGGIEKFNHDPGVECFLLHARAHSSGLNLVNASHVFLCEPLINTALELQAIARVHRIGQLQSTTVWLYIIDGTVEESIYEISVQRRLQHMGQYGKGKSVNLTPEELENGNSMELQHASTTRLLTKGRMGGEVVDKDDLWSCLFGSKARTSMGSGSGGLDTQIRSHLGAEAAHEKFMEQVGNR